MGRYDSHLNEGRDYRSLFFAFGVLCLLGLIGFVALTFMSTKSERFTLDDTLCPPQPTAYIAMVVDVTDPLTPAQRQDFKNRLEEVKVDVPVGGKIAIFKVDSPAGQLNQPIFEVCNPGSAADCTIWDCDPTKVQSVWVEGFNDPLDEVFEAVASASKSDTSPILQSIQSAKLLELDRSRTGEAPRKLIVVSDFLQNTPGLSFYDEVPSFQALLNNSSFASARTDLKDIEVQVWMLQRSDHSERQPRSLMNLWAQIIEVQGGELAVPFAYNVSG